MGRKVALILAVMATVATPAPAWAGHTQPVGECVVPVDEASAENPHIVDPPGDWNGMSGNGQDGVGELYREGVDLTAAWVARGEADGITANIEVAELGAVQPNTIFYFIWYYPDTSSEDGIDRSTRWVSARLRGYAEPIFTHGYLGPGVTSTQFFTEGTTTGSLTTGAPGRISIDLPLEDMGIDPTPGEHFIFIDFAGELDGGIIGAESRILLGSPEPLPPPSPLRHGFVYEADTMDNFVSYCDAVL